MLLQAVLICRVVGVQPIQDESVKQFQCITCGLANPDLRETAILRHCTAQRRLQAVSRSPQGSTLPKRNGGKRAGEFQQRAQWCGYLHGTISAHSSSNLKYLKKFANTSFLHSVFSNWSSYRIHNTWFDSVTRNCLIAYKPLESPVLHFHRSWLSIKYLPALNSLVGWCTLAVCLYPHAFDDWSKLSEIRFVNLQSQTKTGAYKRVVRPKLKERERCGREVLFWTSACCLSIFLYFRAFKAWSDFCSPQADSQHAAFPDQVQSSTYKSITNNKMNHLIANNLSLSKEIIF